MVTPVEPLINPTNGEVDAYGFRVYFDTVEFGDDIQADILIDRHNIIHDLHGVERFIEEGRD